MKLCTYFLFTLFVYFLRGINSRYLFESKYIFKKVKRAFELAQPALDFSFFFLFKVRKDAAVTSSISLMNHNTNWGFFCVCVSYMKPTAPRVACYILNSIPHPRLPLPHNQTPISQSKKQTNRSIDYCFMADGSVVRQAKSVQVQKLPSGYKNSFLFFIMLVNIWLNFYLSETHKKQLIIKLSRHTMLLLLLLI